MVGTPLEEFTTLAASQGPAWMTGTKDIVNETVKRTYTYPRMVKGNNVEDMVQGGDQITDIIFLDLKSTAQRYNPNARFNVQNPQTGTQWTVPWAFLSAHTSWTKQELGLNRGGTTRRYRAQVYKKVLWQKHQNLWSDICNFTEDEYWAQPSNDLMESASPTSPRVPYSIPVFVNEFTDGLPPNFTTVQGISSATFSNWANQTEDYTYDASTDNDTIFTKMSLLYRKVKFDRLPMKSRYGEKSTVPQVVYCSTQGMANYEHALRANQDEFRAGQGNGQDPEYHNPVYRGIPLDYIEALDTAALYDDGASGFGNEGSGATITGPRYYFLNLRYIRTVHHSENYFVLTEPMTPSDQPFSRVQYVDCWNNNICRSRQRQGLLKPSASTQDA